MNPTTKRIILKDQTGHLHVVIPARPIKPGETEKEYLDDIASKAAIPGTAEIARIDASELPASRSFRSQWRHDGTAVKVDMALARVEKMKRIREKRNQLLAATDGEYLKQSERGTASQALKTKRQSLRDIPQNTNLSTISTPEELEAFEPTWPA